MLSVIIPARNEKYLEKTIKNILDNVDGDIEVLAVLDGYLPEPQIVMNDERVIFIHNEEAIGQRQSINLAAKQAKGKFIMKLDAHCALDKGFDLILARDCEYDMTMVPRMYNLDVTTWKPKKHKRTDYMYISSMTAEKPFRSVYYDRDPKRNRGKKQIDDIMTCMGPCFFMHKDRFWELEGCDEGHGGWGQQGIEVACKAWLSGGRLVVNKNTWFAHWFRGGGVPVGEKSGFPYPIKWSQQEAARKYSQDLWLNNKWHKAVRPFQFMIDKFNPPGWNTNTILYYTDGMIKEPIKSKVIENLKSMNLDVVQVSNEGKERSHLQLFKNIQRGLKEVKTKYVATAEHDCLYPKEHFEFKPEEDDVFYYDTNHWWLDYASGKYFQPYANRAALSGLVCNTELLKKAVDDRIEFLQSGGVLLRGIKGACEFGIVDNYKSKLFKSLIPYIDIRHGKNFSGNRKSKRKSSKLPFWGTFDNIFATIPEGRWYQEATIRGKKMPQRRKNDTNEKRWKTFIEPLIRKDGGVFTDLGANAGFYCRKMADKYFKSIAVERAPEFLKHAHYWENQEPKGIKIVGSDINDYKLRMSQVVLLANIHYWLTPEQNKNLVEQLNERAMDVIVIGRYKTLGRHASPCTIEYLRELFKGWKEVKVINGSKHFSVLFENPNLVEKNVDDIFHHQQLFKSDKFLPSYKELIDLVISGKKYNPLTTEYFKYLEWRKFKAKGRLMKRHTKLITDIINNGIREPLTIDGNKITDGDHRLIIAKEIGIKKLICK